MIRLDSKRIEVDGTLQAIELAYERGWTDGLPIMPPTEGLVEAFLQASGRRPDDVLGTIPQRSRTISAEKVAINAVMAGCLPSYAPVVMAAVEAMTDEAFNLHGNQNSTGGAAIMVIVNGPIVDRIGLNYGVNAMGSGHRANATIGRALRLLMINVAGGVSGVLDKSVFGWPGKYSFCLAENEHLYDWAPLHVDRGLPPGSSAVTVFAALAPNQVSEGKAATAEELFEVVAAHLRASRRSGCFAVVLCPEHVRVVARDGWSKRQAREFLAAKAPEALVDGPGGVLLFGTGGEAGGFFAVVPPWGPAGGSRPVTRTVEHAE
jgi:hypothetical protein